MPNLMLLPMHANIPFPLSLEYVRSAPPDELLAGLRSWVKETDSICLVHPHGFFVALLHRSAAEDWRFHWWPAGPKNLTGMPALIHTHNKVVESRILSGELKNVIYDATEVAVGGQPLYEVAYLGDKYAGAAVNVLQKTTKRVQATIRSVHTLAVGKCYSVERHVYHKVVVPNDVVTATIVCMHSPSPGPVAVVGLDGYPERIEFQRTECRAAERLGLV